PAASKPAESKPAAPKETQPAVQPSVPETPETPSKPEEPVSPSPNEFTGAASNVKPVAGLLAGVVGLMALL
ncbi:unnamed protein product, partial [Penicillium nalgiovense]